MKLLSTIRQLNLFCVTLLAVFCVGAHAQNWDYSQLRDYGRFPISDNVFALAFSPNGKILAAGTRNQVILYSLTGEDWGKIANTLLVQDSDIDAQNAAMADNPLQEAPPKIESVVNHLVFSPDGKIVAGACVNSGIKLWDAETGKLLHALDGNMRGTNAIAFSPDGKVLASGGGDKKIILWDVATGKSIRSMEKHLFPVVSLAFSRDGKTLTSLGAHNKDIGSGELKVWNIETGNTINEQIIDYIQNTTATLGANGQIAASTDSGTADGINIGEMPIPLWDAKTGALARRIENHKYAHGVLSSIVFTTEGSVVAGAGVVKVQAGGEEHPDTTYGIGIWDVKNGNLLGAIGTDKLPNISLVEYYDKMPYVIAVFSPNGRAIVMGTGKIIRVFAVP